MTKPGPPLVMIRLDIAGDALTVTHPERGRSTWHASHAACLNLARWIVSGAQRNEVFTLRVDGVTVSLARSSAK